MSEGDSDSTDEFDGGFILSSVVKQIQNILQQYPDDGQILKELVQNAEDAGATQVIFLHDQHSYLSDCLLNEHLSPFQGPSLLAYNDAKFSEEDWKGIRMLQDSVKEDDPLKVGRFGLGFKSVFHVTDMPGLLSGPRIGLLDPQTVWLKEESKSLSLVKHEKKLKCKDQILPYCHGIFHSENLLDEDCKEYPHTLFRFPLRSAEMRSKLTDGLYDENKVLHLFKSFEADAHLNLLFLRNLEQIELYQRLEDDDEPKLCFKVEITKDCLSKGREQRNKLKEHLAPLSSDKSAKLAPLTISYCINVRITKYDTENQSEAPEEIISKWIVCQHFDGTEVMNKFSKVKSLPSVAAALPVSDADEEEEIEDPQGNIFCFLPLPVQEKSLTGLPFHVHGYFALEANRRHIKLPGAEQDWDEVTDIALLWNKHLIKNSLPHAIKGAFVDMIDYCQQNSCGGLPLMRSIPDADCVVPTWKKMLKPLFRMIENEPILYTEAHEGKWIKVKDAVFEDLTDCKDTIQRVLISANVPLVIVSKRTKESLRKYGRWQMKYMTPSDVTKSLKKVQEMSLLTNEDKVSLLNYLLAHYEEVDLTDLELLPLLNGEFTRFARKSAEVYIPSEEHPASLLPGLEHRLMDKSHLTEEGRDIIKSRLIHDMQVRKLSKQKVKDLLPRVFSETWSQLEFVDHDENNGRITLEWLEEIWIYISKHFGGSLAPFEDLHLLPVSINEEMKLAKLYVAERVVLVDSIAQSTSQKVRQALQKLDIIVTDSVPDFILDHPQVTRRDKYLLTYSAQGVLRTLQHRSLDKTILEFDQLASDTDRDTLKNFLAQESKDITSDMKDIARQLPIFRTCSGVGFKRPEYTSLKGNSKMAPAEELPVKSTMALIDTADDETRDLTSKIGSMTKISVPYILNRVFGEIEKCSDEERESLAQYLLTNLDSPSLVTKDKKETKTFKDSLRTVPLFLNRNKRFTAVQDMFVTEDEVVNCLINDPDKFPAEMEMSHIQVLKKIGLKTRQDISPDEILSTASDLDECSDKPVDQELIKSQKLVYLLQQYPEKLEQYAKGKPLNEQLKELHWLCVESESLDQLYPSSLTWYGRTAQLQKVTDCYTRSLSCLVGSVAPIVDVGALAKKMGVREFPELCHLVEHLKNVTESYCPDEKDKYLSTVKKIYEKFGSYKSNTVTQELCNLEVSKWIWFGEGFAGTDEITLEGKIFAGQEEITSGSLDLRPSVYTMPPEMQQYRKLLESCGVKDGCDLLDVLRSISARHSSSSGLNASVVSRDLKIALDILRALKPAQDKTLDDSIRKDLLIPVQSSNPNKLEFELLENCTYCDKDWLKQGYDEDDIDDDTDLKLSHPDIPPNTAELLGIPSLMSRYLSDAEEMGITDFGQSESLTSRLNKILEEYTDGMAVFKEIIQNADDAGATEVKFMYDERTNDTIQDRLLDEGMKECHGPALWAYNNSTFSDADFENILKLGGATKKEETSKIGRFGLGFNAVYNLTDVPSFISKQYLAIFDPNKYHLGRSMTNKNNTGIKLDIQKRKKMNKLANQFKPFDGVFGCQITTQDRTDVTYDGTLFRFPLRTKSQADRSGISNKSYNQEKMIELLSLLLKSSEALLLFTQNILRVSVYHLKADASDGSSPELLYSFGREADQILTPLLPEPILSQVCRNEDEDDKLLLGQSNILSAVSEEMKRCRGTFAASPESVRGVLLQKVHIKTTPSAKKMLSCKKGTKYSQWITSSSIGSVEAYKIAQQDKSLVPVGGVAIELTQTESSDKTLSCAPMNGKIYCFLPLDIQTHLGVHVNGYFAVTASRKYLCEKSDDDIGDKRGIWNQCLAKDAICKAFINLLESLKKVEGLSNGAAMEILPCNTPKRDVPCEIRQQLLRGIVRDDCQIFTDGERYARFSEIHFLDPKFRATEIGVVALKTFRQLRPSWLVVDMPENVIDALVLVGCQEEVDERMYSIRKFFEEILLPRIDDVDTNDRDHLVLKAITMTDEIDDLVRNYTCIPVQPTGELKKPSELVSPFGRVAELYNTEDRRFPQAPIAKGDKLDRALVRLGMKTDDVPWFDILDRAQRISSTAELEEARRRCKALVTYMEEKLVKKEESCYENIREKFLFTNFLPVMAKPERCPVPWKEEGSNLTTADTAYLADNDKVLCCVEVLIDSAVLSKYRHTKTVRFLGLKDKTISIGQLIAQLTEIKQNFTGSEQSEYIREVYNELQRKLQSESLTADILKASFEERELLFIENEFRRINKVALKDSLLPRECYSYLCSPSLTELRNFSTLYQAVGVKTNFAWNDYASALIEMKEKYGANPLEDNDLPVAKALLECICDLVKREKLDLEETNLRDTVMIPDADRVLQKCSEMCFNNCPWMEPQDDMKLTHPTVSHQNAELLGMRTIREDALDKNSDDLGVDFGQSEKLTNRLKRILDGYPKDTTILKELIQNADDAGATEIHLVFDPRQHNAKRVFEDKWKPLQGPALLVYNNKPFTEPDMKGIQNLGEGTKGDDPTKTGQYGIGFNCVYHLTDTPMFLTKGEEVGETLCAFDPHCEFVPGATKHSPGRRFKNVEKLRLQFPDVFGCFLPDMFNIDEATLFRFPLRKKLSSKIGRSISEDDVLRLLKEFASELPESLLFLNNLQKITVSTIDKRSQKMQQIYQATADLDPSDIEKREMFARKVKEVALDLTKNSKDITTVRGESVLYSMSLTDSNGTWKEYRVGQQIGYNNMENIPDTILNGYKGGDIGLLPRGGVAVLRCHSETQEARKPKSKCASKVFCFLPLPKTNLELPDGVHINGHFALDYESRRGLKQRDIPGMKVDWNEQMMAKVIAPLYAQLMEDNTIRVNEQLANKPASIYSVLWKHTDLFPSTGSRHQKELYMDILHDAIYQNIYRRSSKVLPVVRPNKSTVEWHNIKHSDHDQDVFFNDLSKCEALQPVESRYPFTVTTTAPNREEPPYDTVRDVLLESNFNLLHLPLAIYDSFTAANVEVKKVTPTDVIAFYSRHPMKEMLPRELNQTPFSTLSRLQKLLTYSRGDEHFFSKLVGLPFVVTCDFQLRVIDGCRDIYLTTFHDLINNQKNKFVDEKLIKSFTPTNPDKQVAFKMLTVADLEMMMRTDPECEFMMQLGETEYMRDENWNGFWLNSLWTFLKEEADKLIPSIAWIGNNFSDQYRQIVNSLLYPLADWCIFPVIRQSKTSLFPLRHAAAAIDLDQGDALKLKQIIAKIKLPLPDYKVFQDGYNYPLNLAKVLVASVSNPAGILWCFQEHMAHTRLEPLPVYEAQCILRYFADNLDVIRNVPLVISTLIKFPYYKTVRHKMVSLEGSHGYIIAYNIPTADMDVFENTKDVVFLASDSSLNELYKYVGCSEMTEVEIYCSFIFEQFHFEMMTPVGRHIHLEYVMRTLLPKLESEDDFKSRHAASALLDKMRTLAFIPGNDGELRTADTLFDPTNGVFLAMHGPELFPPKEFTSYIWLEFLRKIGMTHEVTRDMFLKYAELVAADATHDPAHETTEKRSRTLIEFLLNDLWNENRYNFYDRTFLNNVGSIPFVAPFRANKSFQGLHPQYGSRKIDGAVSYTAFRGSFVTTETTALLLWSSSSLVPYWTEPKGRQKKSQIVEWLGILLEPNWESVVKHLIKLCKYQDTKLFQTTGKKSTMEESDILIGVLKGIYRFLQNVGNVETFRDQLQNVKCIAVEKGRRLVYPRQVAVDMVERDEIRPYLYKIPMDLGEYTPLFERIGVPKETSAQQYAAVLEAIHRDTKNLDKMNPPDIYSSIQAFIGLIEKSVIVLNLEHPLANCEVLHLPSRDKKLQSSSQLIFSEDPLREMRLRKLNQPFVINSQAFTGRAVEFKEKYDNFKGPKMSKFFDGLPAHLKPINLDDFIEERMEEQPPLEDVNENSAASMANEIGFKLSDPRFAQGLLRLLRHEQIVNGGIMDENPVDQEKQINEKITIDLARLKIVRVAQDIVTHMYYKGSKVEDSEKTNDMFYRETKDEEGSVQWILYVSTNSKEMKNSFFIKLAKFINKLIGSPLGESLVMLPAMLQKGLGEISSFLDSADVKALSLTGENGLLPTPGDPIPVKDHHLLRQDLLDFRPYEYVGYEVDDPLLRPDAAEDLDCHPTIIHALVIRESDESVDLPFLRKYEVEVGFHDRKTVDALSLYKWFTPKSGLASDGEDNLEEDDEAGDIKVIKSTITDVLTTSLNLSEEQRLKIEKRLILKWLPENNAGKEDLCEQIIKHIESECIRLDKLKVTDGSDGDSDDVDCNNYSAGSGGYRRYGNRGGYGGGFVGYLRDRARVHQQDRTRYEQEFTRSQCRRRRNYIIPPSFCQKNPQPLEARRWLRQATCDLDATENDMISSNHQYNWVCFKAHQATEKALKAVHYSIDYTSHDSTHQLINVALPLGNETLLRLARQLQELLGNPARMRYPEHLTPPSIPHDEFQLDVARQAREIAKEVVDTTRNLILPRQNANPIDEDCETEVKRARYDDNDGSS